MTQEADGSYFGPKHLKQTTLHYSQFIANEQAKLGQHYESVCCLNSHLNHQLLTSHCMAPKCKHDNSSLVVQGLNYTHDDLLNSEEPIQVGQTNVVMHAGQDVQGCPTIHTLYQDEKLPALESIYGALGDDESQMSSYSSEEFATPLEDNMSPTFHEHQVPEDEDSCDTASSYQLAAQILITNQN